MQNLKSYLTRREMTQADFAKLLGVSQPTISEWLNGKMKPSMDSLLLISRKTGLSLDDLAADLQPSVSA